MELGLVGFILVIGVIVAISWFYEDWKHHTRCYQSSTISWVQSAMVYPEAETQSYMGQGES